MFVLKSTHNKIVEEKDYEIKILNAKLKQRTLESYELEKKLKKVKKLIECNKYENEKAVFKKLKELVDMC